jgi:hypothetical protein
MGVECMGRTRSGVGALPWITFRVAFFCRQLSFLQFPPLDPLTSHNQLPMD